MQVKPEDVVAVEAIRAAMGVGFLDDEDEDDEEDDEPITGVTESLDTPLGQGNSGSFKGDIVLHYGSHCLQKSHVGSLYQETTL